MRGLSEMGAADREEILKVYKKNNGTKLADNIRYAHPDMASSFNTIDKSVGQPA